MQRRLLVGAAALLAGIALGSFSTRMSAAPSLKWALINLTEATSIAGTFVTGPVMFLHDDARMARGEPCTSVHRFVPGKGPGEELVSFHCKPRWRSAGHLHVGRRSLAIRPSCAHRISVCRR